MKHTWSIRTTAVLLYVLMILVPVGLIVAVESAVTSYHRGETNALTRLFKPRLPFVKVAKLAESRERMINVQMLEDPDVIPTDAFLRRLDSDHEALAIALRIEDELRYVSDPLEAEELSLRLPEFGRIPGTRRKRDDRSDGDTETEGGAIPEADRTDANGADDAGAGKRPPPTAGARRIPAGIITHMDFRLSDGTPASIFTLSVEPEGKAFRPGFSTLVTIWAMAVLLLVSGLFALFFIQRMTKPLRRLEAAALTMSRGEFDAPVVAPKVREVARVFDAFETMRRELRDLLTSQREYEESRRRLIANLSHDLKTPTTAIRGYVEGLRDGVANTPEKFRRYLDTIHNKVGVLDRMITQLFLLSTLEVHEAPFVFRAVDLCRFLRDSIEEIASLHPGGSLRVRAHRLEQSGIIVRADPLQLRRVIENIVDNAIRHGDRDPLTVTVDLDAAGGESIVRISDDGVGITEQMLPHVFERSYRGDQARSSAGSGLGLTIAREIVEAHGGEITVDSVLGEGTTVSIRLPRSDE